MASDDSNRANWKDPTLVKLFLDLCIEQVSEAGKQGSSLKKDSWLKIIKSLEEKRNLKLNQKQMKNQWNYLKGKYTIWSNIVGKSGHGFDPVTNTVTWSPEEWDEYIKRVPEAKQYRYIGLQFADEMKSLFDGITATGKDGWGPSKETMPDTVNLDDLEFSFANEQVNLESPIDVDLDSPNSTTVSEKKNGKRHKKNKVDDIDAQLMAVLKTLGESDGPTIEECNVKLDEMSTLTVDDPLYILACSIFCESKAYREQWMVLSKKSEDVRINWIKIVAKKLGFL